ncbi:MAG TPA: hypothetical protein DCE52_13185, partial [Rhodobacteraceae bacterium]|nr:hypothetical protein [Paracoccaceae bacterium]
DDDEKTIEQKIYGRFYSDEDKSILEEFQLGTWEERLNLLSRFSDERLKQLGRRLIAFNAPDLLTQKELDAFNSYTKNKWETVDEKSNWTTTSMIKMQIEELAGKGCDMTLLNDLKVFYKERLADRKCFIEFD